MVGKEINDTKETDLTDVVETLTESYEAWRTSTNIITKQETDSVRNFVNFFITKYQEMEGVELSDEDQIILEKIFSHQPSPPS